MTKCKREVRYVAIPGLPGDTVFFDPDDHRYGKVKIIVSPRNGRVAVYAWPLGVIHPDYGASFAWYAVDDPKTVCDRDDQYWQELLQHSIGRDISD